MKDYNNVSRNGSGYYDGVAAKAVRKVDGEYIKEMANKGVRKRDRAYDGNVGRSDDEIRFKKLLGTIFNMCELAGFSIESRMVVKDKTTGKIWK